MLKFLIPESVQFLLAGMISIQLHIFLLGLKSFIQHVFSHFHLNDTVFNPLYMKVRNNFNMKFAKFLQITLLNFFVSSVLI